MLPASFFCVLKMKIRDLRVFLFCLCPSCISDVHQRTGADTRFALVTWMTKGESRAQRLSNNLSEEIRSSEVVFLILYC